MNRSSRILAALILFLCPALVLAQDPELGMTPEDVMSLRIAIDAVPSPDGTLVAYRLTQPRGLDEEPGPDHIHLWLGETTGEHRPRRLVGGRRRISGVAFRPDGSSITFLDRREDAPHTEVYALPLGGGEPYRLTTTATGVGDYAWRKDGRALAFSAPDPLPAGRAAAWKAGFRPVIVDENARSSSLWLWEAYRSRIRRLTTEGSVMSFVWDHDGKRLAAAIAPSGSIDDRYVGSKLYLVDPETDEVRLLADNPGKLGDYSFSPDGRFLAWIGAVDRRDPHAGMLHLTEVETGATRLMTVDFKGMVHQVIWSDAGHVVCVASYGVHTHIGEVDIATSQIRPLGGGGQLAFEHVRPVPGRPGSVVGVASSARHPGEVFRLDNGGRNERISWSNDWLEDYALGEQEVTTVKARDGLEIEGILIKPLHFDESKRYPLVIVVHGGPEAHFLDGWNTDYARWGQVLSARGYLVWYPNYRSSTGYGVAFAKADHGDPMGREFEDHLDAIAAFERRGLVDPKRVGIVGGSYGGYTAAWAATRHSEHFAAAVSFVPFTHIRTKWLCSDIPNEFHRVHYEEKWPHEQKDFLDSRSPLEYAPLCRTPLLLAGGDADPRVDPSQPFMLYRAIKFATTTPVRYVRYPGEGHGNRVNVNRYDFMLRGLRFLDHYLKEGDRKKALPPQDIDYAGWERIRRD
ncbi:MAG: S9 family peptidase [Planctomycetes bacterium]|nr:S9 family peptidase [Planctomycetota bacterium]